MPESTYEITRIHDSGLNVSWSVSSAGLDAEIGSFIRTYSLVGEVEVREWKMIATKDGEFLTSFAWKKFY